MGKQVPGAERSQAWEGRGCSSRCMALTVVAPAHCPVLLPLLRLQSRSNSLLGRVGGIVGVKHGEGGCHLARSRSHCCMLLWILPKPVHMPSCQSPAAAHRGQHNPRAHQEGAGSHGRCLLSSEPSRVPLRQIQVPPVGSRQCWKPGPEG